MEIPISDKELDFIIELLEKHGKGQLYAKLWSFKFNKNIKKRRKK